MEANLEREEGALSVRGESNPNTDRFTDLSNDRRSREPWGWLFVVSTNAFLLIGGMLTSLTVYASFMQRHFDWSETAAGIGPVALLLGMSVGNLLVGATLDRLGLRYTFLIGAFIAVVSWTAAGCVQTLSEFTVVMAVAGLGIGISTIIPGITLLSNTFHERRGLAIAIFVGACAISSSIMPIITKMLIVWSNWRITFWVVGGVVGALGLSLLCTLPHRTEKSDTLTFDSNTITAFDTMVKRDLDRRQVFSLPAFWMLTVGLTLSQLGINGVLFNVVSYLQKGGYDTATAVYIYGASNLMSLPGLLIGGFISDRIGGSKMLPTILAFQAVGTAMLLGVGIGSLDILGVIGFIVIWGGVSGLPVQGGALFLGEMIGQKAYPFMLGIMFTITDAVGAFAPPLMGWTYELFGGYFWPVAMLAFITLMGMFAVLRSRLDG